MADIGFDFTVEKIWQEPSMYSYLQVGVADILHVLFAEHLGCKYIASFDKDFTRVKNIIERETSLSLLESPEAIIAVLTK